MKVAFAYTGQGSQKVGMGLDFFEEYPVLHDYVTTAQKITGIDFLRLFKEGPAEELNYTPNTQPSVVLFEVMVTILLKSNGIEPIAVMGHSLGEYSALYAAEVLDFETLMRVVAKRGELMQKYADANPGTMAAVLGLSRESVEKLCERASDRGVVSVSNVNLPTQIVVSGETKAVEYLSELATQEGAKRVVPLKVSGPFHSKLMEGARKEFAEFLNNIEFKEPKVAFISNNAGQVVKTGAELKELLLKQFVSGVDWVSCVKTAKDLGVESVLEIGPSAVLASMIRKIVPDFEVNTVSSVDNLKNLLQKNSQ